jgi:hypothetical protein
MIRLFGLFDAGAKLAAPDLGKPLRVDTTQTRCALGIEFIPARDAAVAMGRSLVELGLI